ncbi:MAG: AAA family ATPase, partial [Patescibacteria group bacterium]
FANVFVSGISGPGGLEAVEWHVSRMVRERENIGDKKPAPNDWVYVYNFKNPRSPVSIPLTKGNARVFQKKIGLLLKKLRQLIPEALTSDTVLAKDNALYGQYEGWFDAEKEAIARRALELGLEMKTAQSQKGVETVRFVPSERTQEPGAEKQEVSEKKPRASKGKLKRHASALRQKPQDANREGGMSEEDLRPKLTELFSLWTALIQENTRRMKQYSESAEHVREEAAKEVIVDLFSKLNVEQKDASLLGNFIDGLREHAEENWELFAEEDRKNNQHAPFGAAMERDQFLPWRVNVFIDNSGTDGTPVVAERVSSIADLVGKVEYRGMMGITFTDHTMIVPGAVARANGGFIILSAEELLTVPGLWQLLKRCIKNNANGFDTIMSLEGYGTSQIDPIPIPLDLRFILFGSSSLINFIAEHDHEFYDLFPVRAEISNVVECSDTEIRAYCNWMRDVSRERTLLPLSAGACAGMIEYAGRVADHKYELTTDFSHLEGVLKEAHVVAKHEHAENISRVHVQKAIHAKFWRGDFICELMRKGVRDSQRVIHVSGESVGRINGLTVLSYGDITFGFPCCITAGVNVGKPGILNIVRDAKMSGNLLNKADETVQGVLKGRFAQRFPLALEICFSFEQSYGMIDGDSASLAEYFVITSRISGVPIKQSIAVTGSLSLLGDVQPIGGVNEKIEGFFDVCVACGGLSGEQGVIIPWQNKVNLMLREDVVQAIKENKFHIWAIRTLDEGIEILTGMSAGTLQQENGSYPDDTFNARVCKKIEEYARHAKEFFEPSKKD